MVYNLIRMLLAPVIYISMLLGGKKGEFLKKRLKEDFSSLEGGDYIWVHCSSVGEINLSETLIKKLLSKRDENILLTMFTDTGIEVARNKFKKEDRVKIYYFPLDSREKIREILDRVKISFLILVETEIWPNLINEVSRVARVILVNGRISDRSFGRYKKLKGFLKNIFKNIDAFYMQTAHDSERIISLGADKEKVETLGNLKFDIEFQRYTKEEQEAFKTFLGVDGRKVFTAGSSRTGEYETLLEVYSKLSDTLLILVPRHIEKTPMIEEMLRNTSYKFKKYSEINEKNIEKTDIIIVDAIGILRKIYSITDIAFVGGTLVNIGGHSLLEPLFYGKTPIFGPYLQNVKEISQDILKYGIGYKVENSSQFLDAIKKVEENQDKSLKLIERLFDENRNTADKIIDKIEKM